MAAIQQKGRHGMKLYRRGEVWWVSVYNGSSRRRVSTGEREYSRAVEAARRIAAPLLMEKQADRIEAAALAAGRLRGESARLQGEALAWSEVWERLAKGESRLGKARAASTLADYRKRWEGFAAAMSRRGFERPAAVPEKEAAAWVASHGPRSRVVCHQVLSMAYRAAGLPCPAGKRPRRPASEVVHRDPLTVEEVRSLLQAPEKVRRASGGRMLSPEYRTLLMLLVYTGLRLGDAARLECGQVSLESGILSRRAGKTGAELRLPLHPALLEELRRVITPQSPPDAPVMPSLAAMEPGSLSHRITALMAAAGIERRPGRHCAHCLRTTFAAMCAEGGVPLGVIQGWLGHASQEVTRVYARVEDMRARRAALGRLPDFTAPPPN